MRRGVIQLGSESFGKALEHLIFLELRAALDYFQAKSFALLLEKYVAT